jgi:hypothetical protein
LRRVTQPPFIAGPLGAIRSQHLTIIDILR